MLPTTALVNISIVKYYAWRGCYKTQKTGEVCKGVSDSEGVPLRGKADDKALLVNSRMLNRRIVEL